MIYLTYGDPPSGVYSSQVTDVVRFLDGMQLLADKVRLVAFISIRGFAANRTKIRNEVPGAVVLPILPKINFWRPSAWWFALLCRMTGERKVIARGVLACNVALKARKTAGLTSICYDGRGAIAAEWEEYEVAPYKNIQRAIRRMESDAVMKTDCRIAVSNRLVDYWRDAFGYDDPSHVVIPCTLNSNFSAPDANQARMTRERLGYGERDIILVYSGSVSGWQSFSLVSGFFTPLLDKNPHLKLLFLSGGSPHIEKLIRDFPEQVSRRWVAHHEVPGMLAAGDYGILLRERKITNRVAAPTKFAEYLSAGLPVLISGEIGDYTDFVREHGCGHVIEGGTAFTPKRTDERGRGLCIRLADTHFTKEAMRSRYHDLMRLMGDE